MEPQAAADLYERALALELRAGGSRSRFRKLGCPRDVCPGGTDGIASSSWKARRLGAGVRSVSR